MGKDENKQKEARDDPFKKLTDTKNKMSEPNMGARFAFQFSLDRLTLTADTKLKLK